MASTWTTKTAAEALQAFLDERVQLGSAAEGVHNVVRLAYKASYDEANGLMQAQQAAPGIRYAAEVATAGRITADDIVNAVRYNMGL